MDFNFFESYKKIVPKTNKKGLIFISIFLLVAATVVFTTATNIYQVLILKKNIEAKEQEMSSESYKKSLLEYEEKSKEFSTVKSERDGFSIMDNYLKYQDTATESLLSVFSNELPDSLYVSSIEIVGNLVKVTGTGNDNKSVANYESSLRNSNYFNYIFVNISEEDEAFLEVKNIVPKTPYKFELTAEINIENVLNK